MKQNSGQVLVEVIVAALIIVFVSIAVTQAITSSVRGVDQATSRAVGVFLSQELVETMRAVALEDWHNITNTTSTSAYYTTTSVTKWVTATGTESVVLNGVTYSRSFTWTEARRSNDTNAIVGSGGYEDPSTVKITTNISWTDLAGRSDSFTQVVYFSRHTNDIYTQTDWSSGPASNRVVTGADTYYDATSSGINATATPGAFTLQLQ